MNDSHLHLDEETLWDALEDEVSGTARAHLETCPACRQQLEEAREALGWARDASVPEPSPLFWEGFRRRVSGRIEQRERWAALGRVAGISALAASLILALRPGTAPIPVPLVPPLPAWTALPTTEEEDAGLALLRAVEARGVDVASSTGGLVTRVIELDDEAGARLAEAARREFAAGEEDL